MHRYDARDTRAASGDRRPDGRRRIAKTAYVTEKTGIAFRPAREAIEAAAEAARVTHPALAEEQAAQEPAETPPQTQPNNGTITGPAQSRPVFDDNWVTIGLGAGVVPSYSGSNDYRVFPLPLIVGRVGGVGISPNGPGFTLNLLSPPDGPGSSGARFSFGPSFRLPVDRNLGRVEHALMMPVA